MRKMLFLILALTATYIEAIASQKEDLPDGALYKQKKQEYKQQKQEHKQQKQEHKQQKQEYKQQKQEIESKLETMLKSKVTPYVPAELKQYYNGTNPLERPLQELFKKHKRKIEAEVKEVWKICAKKQLLDLKECRAGRTVQKNYAALPHIEKIYNSLSIKNLIPYIPKESPVFAASDGEKTDYVLFWRDEFFNRLVRLSKPFPYDNQEISSIYGFRWAEN